MVGIVCLVFVLLLQNRCEYLIELSGGYPYRRMLVSMFGYIVRPVVLALFSGICFMISEDNRFVRGPLGYTCHLISALQHADR